MMYKYVCICTGIQHNGNTIAATINRAKPSAAELISIFDDHIADEIFALCHGLHSYHAFPRIILCYKQPLRIAITIVQRMSVLIT